MSEEIQEIYDLEAERNLLGSAMLSEDSVNPASHRQAQRWVLAFAQPIWFFSPPHKRICQAIRKLTELGFAADLVSIRRELAGDLSDCGGVEYLIQVCEAVPTGVSVEHYGKLVHEAYVRRELIRRCSKIVEKSQNCPLGELPNLIGDAGMLTRKLVLGHEAIWEAKDIELTEANQDGLPTGFQQIDKVTTCRGYAKGHLSVWLGPPGNGKTTAMLQSIIGHADPFDESVVFVTLEMSKDEILRTWIKMDSGHYRTPSDLFALEKFKDSWSKIKRLNPTIYEPTGEARTVESICGVLESMHQRTPLKLIFLDYVQLVQSQKAFRGDRVRELDYIIECLKNLAKVIGAPIILAAQNTGGGTVKKSIELTIKGSKAIEEAAALIIGLVRDENDAPDCRVLKNRFGGARPVIGLTYDKKFARFTEPEKP